MKTLNKKRFLQKLWGWICLSINLLIIYIYMLEVNTEFPRFTVFLCVMPICYGTIKTYVDISKGDTSIAPIVIEYICVYILTFLIAFKIMPDLSSLSVFIVLLIAFVTEMLVFLLITYWYIIRGIIKKGFYGCK